MRFNTRTLRQGRPQFFEGRVEASTKRYQVKLGGRYDKVSKTTG